MSVGPGAAAAAADGAETEKKDEDQEDPEVWAAASATSPGGSRAPTRRRLPRRDPSKLRDAMGRPLWRLLDTEPLEGIGPGRAGRYGNKFHLSCQLWLIGSHFLQHCVENSEATFELCTKLN